MDPVFFREICGASASLIGIVAYVIYLRGIFRHGQKPHVFTWFLGGVLTFVIWYVQFIKGAGPGAWVTFITAFFCLVIAIFSWTRGEKKITVSDWIAFVGGLAAIPLWYFTKDPLPSVILLTGIDVVSIYPTIRKTLPNPWQENLLYGPITAVKYALGICAIEKLTFINVLYPATMLIITVFLYSALFFLRRLKPRTK